MSLVKVKRNGNLFPRLFNNLLDTDVFEKGLLDINSGLTGLGSFTDIPSLNVKESDKDYKIELAAPGLKKDDFKVEIENDVLSISSEKEKEKSEEDENYRRKEFSYESFNRSLQLPENSLPEKLDAKYENGILKLTLPKKEVTTTKTKKEIKVA